MLSNLFVKQNYVVNFIKSHFPSSRFSSRGPYIHPTNDPIVSNVRNELGHQGTASNAPRIANDAMCPICLASASNPVETNCGHYFCG